MNISRAVHQCRAFAQENGWRPEGGLPPRARAELVTRQERGSTMLAEDWGTGQVLWSIIWFTMFFIWIYLMIVVFADIFRSHDLGGWAKFFWVLLIIVFPFLGIFIYLIARGHKMSEHARQDAQVMDAAQRAYIRDAVNTSPADEISRLADLKSQGVI